MKKDGPSGHLLVEVGDIASRGNAEHDARVAALRRQLELGERKSKYGGEGDYAGRTVLQARGYGCKAHPA
eukprot:15453414-Alexandrium_andersonii.AAC.1